MSNIASVTDPETGAVTLYLRDVKGGPIVTGKDLTEAMQRWQEAFALFEITKAFSYFEA